MGRADSVGHMEGPKAVVGKRATMKREGGKDMERDKVYDRG